MKKLIIGTGIYVVFLVLLTIANNVVLLNLHDLSYYYTWDGIKLTAIVMAVEAIVITPLTKVFFVNFMGNGEFNRIFGDKEDES